MPHVTVVIPAYNPGEFLRRALDSVVAQTFADWDVVVVDDGGAEDLSWVDGYHPQVRRHCQPNRGVSAARNVAASLTDAPLLAYLDQDDEWLPDKLARQVEADRDLSWTAFLWVHADGREQPNPARAFDYLWFLADGHTCLSSLLVRRELLVRVGGFNPLQRVQQDYDVVLRLLAAGATTAPVEEVLVRYHLHDANVSADYLTAYRERVHVVQGHRIDAERRGDDDAVAAARAGERRARSLYGAQAFEAFRARHRPADLVRAATWHPGGTARSLARALS